MMVWPPTTPLALEPQARAGAAAAARVLAAAADGADDDFLTFLKIAAKHLGEGAVADAEGEADGLWLFTVEDVDAAGRAAAAAAFARAHLVVFRPLLGREDLADAPAGGFTDALALLLPLGVGQALQRHH